MPASVSTSERPVPQARHFKWGWLAAWLAAYLVGTFTGWMRSVAGSRPEGEARAKPTEIDRKYADLRRLMTTPGAGSETEERIQKQLAELRHLQREEAASMRARFESRLHLKPGEGVEALRNARALLTADEDPASADASS